jgi:hypothetical protein
MSVDTGAVSGRLSEALASAFSRIDAFDASVMVQGTTEAVRFHVRSDLDNRLSDAVGNLVRKETAEFTARLEREIKERINKPMAEAGNQLKTFSLIGDELTRRLNLGQNLLKADVFKGVKLPM